jgi:prepilin-type N-terminal cleavage/methylation domain-containing protein
MTIALIPRRPRGRGFTLAELLVAMAITVLLLTILVSVTGVALDGWRISRNKVRAARQAKAALEQLSRDFESMVIRPGNDFEWFYAKSESDPPGPNENKSPNAARLVFFTAATDRYNGDVDGGNGDVSAVAYRLYFKDPITGDSGTDYDVFALYRKLVNPDEAFEDFLAQEDLEQEYQSLENDLEQTENFLCENIFELSVVFLIEYNETTSEGQLVTRLERVPILSTASGDAAEEFRVRGTGIEVDQDDDVDYAKGRIVAVDITVGVLTDNGVATLKNVNFQPEELEKFLSKNTHRYSKTILLPQP